MRQNSENVISDARRMLIAGGINTALTSMIFFISKLLTSPTIAYAIAWLAGILFVMAVYPDRVFVGGDRSNFARLTLGILTISVFVIGLCVFRAATIFLGNPNFAFVFTLFVTTALNFISGRILLRRHR